MTNAMKMKAVFPLVVAILFPASAYAQWMVSDPVAEQGILAQYAAMAEEITILSKQLDEAKKALSVSEDQLKSLGSGVSGIGMDNFEDYTADVPIDWRSTLAAMQRDDKTGQTAREIRDRASRLNDSYFADVAPDVKAGLAERMDSAAIGQAVNSAVLDASGERFDRLESLRLQISKANDLKTINDLQARIQIENALVMNELVRLQSINKVVGSEREVRAEEARQRRFEMTRRSY